MGRRWSPRRRARADPGARGGRHLQGRPRAADFAARERRSLPGGGARPALSGRFLGDLDVDDFHATSSGTETDAFVLFLDEQTKATGLTTYGGLGAEKPNEVVVAPSGFVFVVGEFAGELVVGDVHASSVEDEDDVFVLKLSPAGEPVWFRAFGGVGRQTATALTFDAAGDLFVGGNAQGSLACASPAPESAGADDFYLMRFDADSL